MSYEIILYILSAVIVFQVVQTLVLMVSIKKSKQLPEHHEKNVSAASSKIIEHANKKAEEIIQNAVDKAEDIVYQSQVFNDKVSKELGFVFKDALEKHKKELEQSFALMTNDYKDAFTVTKQSFVERSNKTIEQIREYGEMEFAMMKDQSASKTAQFEEYIRKKIDMQFEEAKKEIDKYKEVEKNKFSQMIRESIAELTNDVLHLSIPKREQERLIIEALEKARKDSIFSE